MHDIRGMPAVSYQVATIQPYAQGSHVGAVWRWVARGCRRLACPVLTLAAQRKCTQSGTTHCKSELPATVCYSAATALRHTGALVDQQHARCVGPTPARMHAFAGTGAALVTACRHDLLLHKLTSGAARVA